MGTPHNVGVPWAGRLLWVRVSGGGHRAQGSCPDAVCCPGRLGWSMSAEDALAALPLQLGREENKGKEKEARKEERVKEETKDEKGEKALTKLPVPPGLAEE